MIGAQQKFWDGKLTDNDDERVRNLQRPEEHAEARVASTDRDDFTTLFTDSEAGQFRALWLEVQGHFVDSPLTAVSDANELLDDVIVHITVTLTNKKMALEDQWMDGEISSTEDLRLMLKRYRTVINQLLSIGSSE